MVEFVRSGRSPEALAKEFGHITQAIRNWVKQDDLHQGRHEDGLTTEERSELRRLRHENRQLKMVRLDPSTLFFAYWAPRVHRRRFATKTEARLTLFEYIEGFYNTRRRHSFLGFLSPIDYEGASGIPPDSQTVNRPQKQSNFTSSSVTSITDSTANGMALILME